MDATTISDDDLHLGIAILDDEHQQILVHMRRLLSCCTDDCGSPAIAEVALEFAACVRQHIRSEEEQMAACAYPGLDRHRDAHQRLIAELDAVLQLVGRAMDGAIADRLLAFMVGWMDDHILGEDKMFADYLREREAA